MKIDKNSKYFLLTVSFFSGMAVMATEISAARLLAPHFGTSLIIWSSIIGVVLFALSVGYYLGGILADKSQNINLLLWLLLFTGLFLLFTPHVLSILVNALSPQTTLLSASLDLFFLSTLISLILFGIPLTILAMVNPFLIKIYSMGDQHIGKISGSIAAVSTVGSLIGTFLPTLWTIPSYGTRATIFSFSAILVIIGLFAASNKKNKFLVLIITLCAAVLPILQNTKNASLKTIEQTESSYNHIKIVEDRYKHKLLIFNSNDAFQSIYHPEKFLYGVYADYYHALPYLIDGEKKKILILGSAGGTISRGLKHFFGDTVDIVGVEIDDKVIELANKHFDLRNQNIRVINEDAAIYLKKTPEKYDLIIADLYQNSLYVQWNFTTREFWQLVDSKLNAHGMVGINVNAPKKDSLLLQAIANTKAAIFKHTYIFHSDPRYFNYMILSSQSEIDFKRLFEDKIQNELKIIARAVAERVSPVIFDPKILILTNDKAPVEFMTSKEFLEYNLSRKTNH